MPAADDPADEGLADAGQPLALLIMLGTLVVGGGAGLLGYARHLRKV